MHPSELFKYLGEPGTGNSIELIVTETSEGVPFRGWILNSSGAAIGQLIDFKFDFIHFDAARANNILRHAPPVETRPQQKSHLIDPSSPRFQYSGEWHDIGGYMRVAFGNTPESRVTISSSASHIDLRLFAHQWSGISMILVDGKEYQAIDLFNSANPLIRRVEIENPRKQERMEITVYPLCTKNEGSYDRQLIIEGAIEYLDDLEMPRYSKGAVVNRGGADFEEAFREHLSELPPNAIVLDIGGGKRQLDDERYINLEYSLYEEPDMFGDAQAIPFKSNSVDLVYCTGVLEHVPDPLLAGREIHRVLKPGGRVLACIPFMQPLHNEPQHFFNATPFGVEKTFSAFSKKDIWWSGAFSGIVKWIAESANLNHLADPKDWSEFLRLAEKISPLVPYDRLKFIAAQTWINAVKD